ncbi:hypothetical protein UR09_02885 [Candidatus Nitromaritima sp. SCGC AAA799-A02]|nr:hypothetical protein UR09_02885 [Candidatus Nitromaritima sp. SCGC AAA799-A02]
MEVLMDPFPAPHSTDFPEYDRDPLILLFESLHDQEKLNSAKAAEIFSRVQRGQEFATESIETLSYLLKLIPVEDRSTSLHLDRAFSIIECFSLIHQYSERFKEMASDHTAGVIPMTNCKDIESVEKVIRRIIPGLIRDSKAA